jgi:hypothetical protein
MCWSCLISKKKKCILYYFQTHKIKIMRQKAFATDVFESLDALATNKNRTSVAVIGRTGK